MLELLKKKNPAIRFYRVEDPEFLRYGRVIRDFDASEIMRAAKTVEMPEAGSQYRPTLEIFENLRSAPRLRELYSGGVGAQIGYCWGHNSFLNATEWHNCSEINVAVKPLVLLLAHREEIRNGKIDASDFSAFYLPAGTTVEVYSSTLHFCPCETEADGFGCVVVLSPGTNTALEQKGEDPTLWAKNKWLLAHEQNTGLVARGAVAGITGENYEIRY